jgi:hypothetical protein
MPPVPALPGHPTPVRLIAQVGVIVVAVMVVAVGLPFLLDHRPGATDSGPLEWSAVQFSESGVLDSITSLGGQLLLAGADADGPAVWISRDGGFGWDRSTVVVRNQQNRDATFLSMGIISGHGDQLLALGHRSITKGNTSSWETALWISHDGGENWEDAPEGSVPQGTLDVVATDRGYVALGQGPNGIPTVWTSGTGMDWRLVASDSTFGDATVEALAVNDGQIVAVGARLSQSSPSTAMAWRSRDGVEWEPIALSRDDSAAAVDVIATDSGFVAVGSQRGVVTGAVAWQSSDGLTWQEVVLDRGGDIGAGFVAALGDRFIAIGGKLLELSTGRMAWSILSPSGPPIPLEFTGQVLGIVAYGDRYVGIGSADCFLLPKCASLLIFGVPPGTTWPERLGAP